MERFRYEPLKPGEIRLLKLDHGSHEDDLHCSIFSTTLEQISGLKSGYEAVSYVWGEAGKGRYIRCRPDSTTLATEALSLTENLEAALRRFRDEVSQRTLWIDALCTYSNRSRIKNLRNLRCLFPLEELNQDRENLPSAFSE
jgi:hypothetical protein